MCVTYALKHMVEIYKCKSDHTGILEQGSNEGWISLKLLYNIFKFEIYKQLQQWT